MQVATSAAGRWTLVHAGVYSVVSYRVRFTQCRRGLLTQFDDGTGVRISLHGRRLVSLRAQHMQFEMSSFQRHINDYHSRNNNHNVMKNKQGY